MSSATDNSYFTPLDEIPKEHQAMVTAFKEGVLRTVEQRRSVLKDLFTFLKNNYDILIESLRLDLGRHPQESTAAELVKISKEITVALNNLSTWAAPTTSSTGMKMLHVADALKIMPEPLGTVLIIGPWNYPLALLLNPLVGALAAGNTVLLKPSEMSGHTSRVLCERLAQCGKLKTVLRVIGGAVPETTRLLECRFDHIFFTGSPFVGRIIMTAAAKFLTPVTLELGGKSPVLLGRSLSTASLQVVAQRVLWGNFLNCGQTCIAPDYVLCPPSMEAALIEQLELARRRFFNQPSPPEGFAAKQQWPLTMPVTEIRACESYGRIINTVHFKRLMNLLGPDCGVIAAGGEADESRLMLAPTIMTRVNLESPLMQTEIFGPILPIIPCESTLAAIEFINAREKPLALYLFAEQDEEVKLVLERVSAGGVTVNDVLMHYATESFPFGGVGQSGMGRYHGKYTFETFSHFKPVLYRSANRWLEKMNELRYPPYGAKKEAWMKAFM